mgnify:CR=1 FL=1
MIESQHFRKDKEITVKMGVDSTDDPYQGKHDYIFKGKENDVKHYQSVIESYNKAQNVEDLDQIMN